MRIRDVLAVVVGLAVVGALGFGAWMWLSETIDGDVAEEPTPGDDAEATADAYLAAWAAGDLRTMGDLVRDPPEDFADRHRQMQAALEPTEIRLERGELATPVDGRATAPVTVSVFLPIVDEPISWETNLELLRDRGQWAVQWTMSTLHPELRPTWRFAIATEEVEREPILAADGTPLAGGGQRVIFGFQPAIVNDPEEVVAAFAEALPGSEVAAERELGRDDLNDDWFYPVVTVSEARADQVSLRLRQASGILRRTESGARTLLDDGFAQHVTGIIAEATAEQLEELGDDAEVGMQIPQFGLEAALDDQLTGSEVIRIGLAEAAEVADTDGGEDPGEVELRVVIGEVQIDPSAPVQTTIDVAVQRAIENTLADVDEPAAIVVIDGSTGAIAGSASRPLGGYNRAFSGRYPPGSTFKVITAEALLATGTTPDDEVSCPGETVVGGLRVPNAGGLDLGTTTFEEAFARSCNTTFAQLGAEAGADALVAATERFGFGVEPLVPLTAFGGSFPEPADTAEVGASSFGQARVEASPLHMASVAAAVAGGTWRQPFLIVDDGPGEQRSLAAGTTDVLRELMRATVTGGTGQEAAVEGQDVGGKTGTAQGTDGVEHAWFIGTWEGFGFAVLVEEGGAGGAVAGPIAGRLVAELVAQVHGEATLDGESEGTDGDAEAEGDPDDPGGQDGADTEAGDPADVPEPGPVDGEEDAGGGNGEGEGEVEG